MRKLFYLLLITFLILGITACNQEGSQDLNSITAEESYYRSTLLNQMQEQQGIINELSAWTDQDIYYQISTPGQIALNTINDQAKSLYERAANLIPPNSMLNIHNEYIQDLVHFCSAIDLLESSIQYLNTSIMDQATMQLQESLDHFKNMTDLLNEFDDMHNL